LENIAKTGIQRQSLLITSLSYLNKLYQKKPILSMCINLKK
jgi:hypothetical protein